MRTSVLFERRVPTAELNNGLETRRQQHPDRAHLLVLVTASGDPVGAGVPASLPRPIVGVAIQRANTEIQLFPHTPWQAVFISAGKFRSYPVVQSF